MIFHSLIFKLQIQCSDDSCNVKDFLSQALDPPSPFSGKKGCYGVLGPQAVFDSTAAILYEQYLFSTEMLC